MLHEEPFQGFAELTPICARGGNHRAEPGPGLAQGIRQRRSQGVVERDRLGHPALDREGARDQVCGGEDGCAGFIDEFPSPSRRPALSRRAASRAT